MATGITLVKKFTYRSDPLEEYSNTYFFTGSTPADAAAWLALMNALVAQEKLLYNSSVSIIRGYGYSSDADDRVAVYTNLFDTSPAAPVAGTLNTTAANIYALPGDDAVWVRWKTSRLNSKGKAIYLRKYFHPAYSAVDAGDAVPTAWKTPALAFGAKLRDGSFLDGRTLTAPGHTDTLVSHAVSQSFTTRTLKRRGKRPSS
jgi:hypothetical protein